MHYLFDRFSVRLANSLFFLSFALLAFGSVVFFNSRVCWNGLDLLCILGMEARFKCEPTLSGIANLLL